ncbi:CGCGG family putative rSAM-modified RiPP protein [Halobaculum gomorrense]|uniref:Putative rSAM target protein, CGCGG family n=1 Tax=Halobaculum gomorrense TaxID=43928 RepID=A0A1M5PP38_9EURY|nr:CGCGG family rSAM-modified RiPP protein [Halobaculum gomorrense]SHH03480.1 putative rSAM target protein, CGCGG family [Halobaculum gomorrense]
MNADATGDDSTRSDASGGDEPADDRPVHDTSWSANLEQPRHADDESAVVADAIDAVEHTAAGVHVNLVTHGDHGHPERFLFPALADRFGDDADWEFVDRCGCGGYVTRVRR